MSKLYRAPKPRFLKRVPALNCVLPIILLVPLYGTISKLSLTSLFTTGFLFVFLTKNKQHLFKCKKASTKISLVFLGVAISWCFSAEVGTKNSELPTEVVFEVETRGNAGGQGSHTQIVGKVTKTSKANQYYIGKKVILKFLNEREFRRKSKKIIIKGILTNKNNSLILINEKSTQAGLRF